MKFWIKVKVQCEAKEVLHLDCEERKSIDILFRGKSGTSDPLALLSSLVGVMDLENSQWEEDQDGWVAHSQDHKEPRFFCAAHAAAGLACLKRGN